MDMFFETLEDRRFLSASMPASTDMVLSRHEAGQKVTVAIPKVVGAWSGSIKMTALGQSLPAVMKITKQSGTKISGTLSASGYASIPFKATLVGNKISTKWSASGMSGTIKGTFSKTSFKGTFSAKYGAITYSGSIAMTRH